ncbi:hypothetical protein [Nonlabens sp. YIK11]|uniref:type IV toxin-antitoxin system AbiEi family antitoxin domain-containing protein n=1 Tax=Nonlabens sp. YIK11 TaxID=1453349 RepID=UPI0012E2F979|nr:hypothetical protein [Nonlabens sp. YIK11]
MRIESFERAKSQIIAYFNRINQRAYTTNDILDIFNFHKETWKIAKYRNHKNLIDFLVEWDVITVKKLRRNVTGEVKTILCRPRASNYDIAQTIIKHGYLSNYSAMSIHQLTEQISKSFYLSYGKSEGYIENVAHEENTIFLSQESIDKAFSKVQRITSEVYTSINENSKFFLVQKKFNDEIIGIVEENGLRYTDLERTLIDIVVRPAYSGGVFEVLKAFEAAKGSLNVSLLNDYLTRLGYIYPYHQSIGFFLDKAGYDKCEYNIFLSKKRRVRFYITYNISNLEYDEKWQVYYPRGF